MDVFLGVCDAQGNLDQNAPPISTGPGMAFDVRLYGAKGDVRIVADGAMTIGSPTLTCATSTPFKSTDVGKRVTVEGAGASKLFTTIAAFVSASAVTLVANAAATVSGAVARFGTDDTAAIQKAINAAATAGSFGYVSIPGGTYFVSANITYPSNCTLRGIGRRSARLLQTLIQKNGTAVTGQYYVFTGTAVTSVNIEGIAFVGENAPFFQTGLADQNGQGAVAAISGSTYVTVKDCRFESLYGNLVRSGDVAYGSHTAFVDNEGYQCGGEVNFNDNSTMISGNRLVQCWAIEAAAENVVISGNVLIDCNTGISIGGDGGYRLYTREDRGGAITGATNATPIVIQSPGHGLAAGDAVNISGVLGNTAANGDMFAGSIVDANHYTLLAFGGGNTVGNGVYTSGGVVKFRGNFGSAVVNNVIDGTVAGGAIQIGQPQVGLVIAHNRISRITGHGIQCTPGTAYFTANPRGVRIKDNSIDSCSGQGIWVSCGDGHVIEGNRVGRSYTTYNGSPYETVTGILVQRALAGLVIRNNYSRGASADIILDGLVNCDFRGNSGGLSIQNSYGNISFSFYEQPPEGVVNIAGVPAFPISKEVVPASAWSPTGNTHSNGAASLATVQTVDATVTTIDTYALPASTDAKFVIIVKARRTDGVATQRACFKKEDDFERIGSANPTRSLSNAANLDNGSDANGTAWAASIVPIGAVVGVRVTGAVGATITWTSELIILGNT